jgi:hypothetical protein
MDKILDDDLEKRLDNMVMVEVGFMGLILFFVEIYRYCFLR